MQCSRTRDEELAGQKMDVLYGEADAEARAAVDAHLAVCAACRQEMESFARVRRGLAAWTRARRSQHGGRRSCSCTAPSSRRRARADPPSSRFVRQAGNTRRRRRRRAEEDAVRFAYLRA